MSRAKSRTDTPWGLFITAAFLAGFFALCHVAGLREHTGMLSGTMPASEVQLALGLLYVIAWFAFVLVAPSCALAGGLHLAIRALAQRLAQRREPKGVAAASEAKPALANLEVAEPCDSR